MCEQCKAQAWQQEAGAVQSQQSPLTPLTVPSTGTDSAQSLRSLVAKATGASFKDSWHIPRLNLSNVLFNKAGSTAVAAGHWCQGFAYTLLGKRKEISLGSWNELNCNSMNRERVNIRGINSKLIYTALFPSWNSGAKWKSWVLVRLPCQKENNK